jgi:DNA modification methylase
MAAEYGFTKRRTELTNEKRVEMWPINRPQPNPHNARVHPLEQIDQLAASIKEFGMQRCIVVDENGIMLTGHGIHQAAQKLGLEQVPVVIADDLTEEQKRAYIIADNQLGQNSHWDSEKLRIEVEALEKKLFDVGVIGFSPEELDRISADLPPERLAIDEDDAPAIPTTPVTAPGDLWVMGNHRLLCGDSIHNETLERVTEGAVASMVFSDLPYGVAYKQPGRNRAGLKEIANDNLGPQFEKFLYEACVQLLKATNGAVYLCMSSSELHTLYKAFTGAGGHWSTFIIWCKDHFTFGRSDYQRQHEHILYGWPRGQQRYWCGTRNQSDVWQIPKPQKSKLHPTMKPVALVERAIRNSCRRGGVVLDPFAGAGATLIACEKTARKARLVELEPRFVDVIVQRWEAYTGRAAILEANGQSFGQTTQERLLRTA